MRSIRKRGAPFLRERGDRRLESKGTTLQDYCLQRELNHLLEQWDEEKNGDLTPCQVSFGSQKRVWWRCGRGHSWQARVKTRTRGTGCPVCANRRVEAGENDLATTHPELARQWHPTKNGTLTPRQVVAGNHRKVWWLCDKGHAWAASVLSRSSSGDGCPVCAGKQVMAGENDLASQFPLIAAQWHPAKNGTLTPRTVTAYSNRRVWWLCARGHAFQAVIADRTRGAKNCPYCTNRKVLAGFNDLATKEPGIAAQWHPELNGALTPQMVTAGSTKKVWWQCAEGHVWKAVVHSRTGSRKHGCPVCAGRIKESREKRYDAMLASTLVEHGERCI